MPPPLPTVPAAAPAPVAAEVPVFAVGNPFLIGAPPSAPVEPPVAIAEPQVDVEATRMSTRRETASSWRLVLQDGQRHPIDPVVLIGRDAAADARWPGARLVSVIDSTKSVSKTHAVIEIDAAGVWITDLRSTNGVFVEQPEGTEFDLEPGIRTAVAPGSEVLLGDYSLTVEMA